jgi:hypothetical protein
MGRAVRIAVKYCGGCNPYYDAQAEKAAVEMRLGYALAPYDPADPPDICLLLKQCSSDCFTDPAQWSLHQTVLLERAGGAALAAEQIIQACERLEQTEQGE